ncbi:unnamed protein product [Symbiodinium natans]|uniref:Uncharacterized protein n=1 Tax=Symbiodinium natans TaxID=878477 RepID=A0A812UWR3_9DINO|nr:unnamed protein product [Symbiodinium natans]
MEERLAATQVSFQKPPLAAYMAKKCLDVGDVCGFDDLRLRVWALADIQLQLRPGKCAATDAALRNDPDRKKSLYEKYKEVKDANDVTAQAMRADRLERWFQDSAVVAMTVRGVLRINDDDTISRSRPNEVRRASALADAVFMMDNADALLEPLDKLNFAGHGAEAAREAKQQEQARQEQMAETQAKYGIQKVYIPQEKPKKKAPPTPQQRQQKKKEQEEVIVFDQPLSVAVGEFDRWMRKYLRRLNVNWPGMARGRASFAA